MGCAGIALLFASRLTRGYAEALEKSLLSRAVELDLSNVEDPITRGDDAADDADVASRRPRASNPAPKRGRCKNGRLPRQRSPIPTFSRS